MKTVTSNSGKLVAILSLAATLAAVLGGGGWH